MKLHCTQCALDFESEKQRCPTCLRQSTVIDPVAKAAAKAKARASDPLMAGDPARGASGWSAFATRLVLGTFLFWGLTLTGPLGKLEGGWRICTVLLGGFLLACTWAFVARLRHPD